MQNKNYWVVKKNTFIGWEGRLPLDKSPQTIQRYVDFQRQFLETGLQEEIVVPSYQEDTPENSINRIMDNLEYHLSEKGVLNFLNFNAGSRVAYYNLAGEIEESVVTHLGLFLRDLRPELEYNIFNMYGNHPLGIYAGSWKIHEEKRSLISPPYLDFTIELATDIWFPWVYGYLEADYDYDWDEAKFDNRALALRHTPRLNRFLMTLRERTLELGGEWVIWRPDPDSEFPPLYSEFTDEYGIKLDT